MYWLDCGDAGARGGDCDPLGYRDRDASLGDAQSDAANGYRYPDFFSHPNGDSYPDFHPDGFSHTLSASHRYLDSSSTADVYLYFYALGDPLCDYPTFAHVYRDFCALGDAFAWRDSFCYAMKRVREGGCSG